MSALVLPEPVALVCTAGFARTAAQAGMVQALHERGVEPEILVGASLGAITASVVAGGSPDPGADLQHVWTRIAEAYSPARLPRTVLRSLAQGQAARQARDLQDLVAEVVPDVTFSQVPRRLLLVATDLTTGQPKRLSEGSVRTAVAASAALPGLFPPVERDGALLIDGGLVEAVPTDEAMAAGAASIVVLDTGAPGISEEAAAALRWWEVGALSYAQLIRSQAEHALVRCAEVVPVVVLSCAEGGLLDLGDPESVIEAGGRAARSTLDALGRGLSTPGLFGLPAGFDHSRRLRRLLI